MPLAHERWFDPANYPSDWSFAVEGATLALLAGALVVTVGVRFVARIWPGVDIPFLGRMAPWMPFAARMHLAVALVGLLSAGVYLSPEMDLAVDLPGLVLGVVMVVVAIAMATGWHARDAALLLIGSGAVGLLGTMLILLVYGSDPELRPLVSSLWPFGASTARPASSHPR